MKNGGRYFISPPNRLFTQSGIDTVLMFCRRCIGPPFNRTTNTFHFPIRRVLKPKRILIIRIPTMWTSPVTHTLYLLHRSFVMICGFPISTNCTIHFNPHSTPHVMIGDAMSRYDHTIWHHNVNEIGRCF
jgi:hypothetical protein